MRRDSLLGNIDSVFTGQGFIVLAGWVVLESNKLPPKDVKLIIWDGTCTEIFNFHFRQDLHDAGFGDCAFQICVPTAILPITGSIVQISAQNDELTIDRGISAANTLEFNPIGSLEHVSLSGVWGWIYDPALWLTSRDAALKFDDTVEIPLPLDIFRPDIPFDEAKKRPLGFGLPLRRLLELVEEKLPGLFLLDGGRHRYQLITSGKVISEIEVDLKTEFSGKIENASRGILNGWAVAPQSPEISLDVEILADGQPKAVTRAHIARPDLAKQNIAISSGGFRILLSHISFDSDDVMLTARPLGSAHLLKGFSGAKFLSRPPRMDWISNFNLSCTAPSVTIIVPIYNAADDLARCIESLLRWTSGDTKLLLIDDASPDKQVRTVMKRFSASKNVFVHHSKKNSGFTKTCNFGLESVKSDDVVLLNSDTIVGPRWLENLQAAAYSHHRHGTATPLSNNAGIFSFPSAGTDNPIPGKTMPNAARLVMQHSGAWYPEIPTGHGFCLYIRRDCLNEVGLLDSDAFPRGYGEENDFCLRAHRLGWTHVLDDRTIVYHKRAASFKNEQSSLMLTARKTLDEKYPEYSPLVAGMVEDPLIETVRSRVNAAATTAKAQAARPRALFVVSTDTGGTPQTNQDLMLALADRYDGWLLRCDAQKIFLYNSVSQWKEPTEIIDLDQPIRMADHKSATYDAVIGRILLTLGIEIVHIRHLAWHSLNLPLVAKRLGIPVVMSFHDFYAVCPTVKLLDNNKQFCAGHCTPGDGNCVAELWPEASIPPLKHRFVHVWRDVMSQTLNNCSAYITTSSSAATVIEDIFPCIQQKGVNIIPHGRSFPGMTQLTSKLQKGRPTKILLPGNLSAAKGAHLVTEIAELAGNDLQFHILGDPGRIKEKSNIVIHGRYKREEFHDHVAEIKPHLGLILSIWPETWSHTLTELWSCGIPVLALNLGAVAERIDAHGGGWLLAADSNPISIFDFIRGIVTRPKAHAAKIQEIETWQHEFGQIYDTLGMAAQYDAVYRKVMRERLAFEQAKSVPVVMVIGPMPPLKGKPLLRERTKNHVDRSVVFWNPSRGDNLFHLKNLDIQALLVRDLNDPISSTIKDAAARYNIPIIVDQMILDQNPKTIQEYDIALLDAIVRRT